MGSLTGTINYQETEILRVRFCIIFPFTAVFLTERRAPSLAALASHARPAPHTPFPRDPAGTQSPSSATSWKTPEGPSEMISPRLTHESSEERKFCCHHFRRPRYDPSLRPGHADTQQSLGEQGPGTKATHAAAGHGQAPSRVPGAARAPHPTRHVGECLCTEPKVTPRVRTVKSRSGRRFQPWRRPTTLVPTPHAGDLDRGQRKVEAPRETTRRHVQARLRLRRLHMRRLVGDGRSAPRSLRSDRVRDVSDAHGHFVGNRLHYGHRRHVAGPLMAAAESLRPLYRACCKYLEDDLECLREGFSPLTLLTSRAGGLCRGGNSHRGGGSPSSRPLPITVPTVPRPGVALTSERSRHGKCPRPRPRPQPRSAGVKTASVLQASGAWLRGAATGEHSERGSKGTCDV